MDITLKTEKRNQMINITDDVQKIVTISNVKEGICIVYCPHTTAGVTINENADPDVVDDILMGLNKIVDSDLPFKHSEGNSYAHIKSSLMGCEKTIMIEKGRLKLGVWQACYFCEFDGPRDRKVYIKIISA